jgi:hypothetical protein
MCDVVVLRGEGVKLKSNKKIKLWSKINLCVFAYIKI